MSRQEDQVEQFFSEKRNELHIYLKRLQKLIEWYRFFIDVMAVS